MKQTWENIKDVTASTLNKAIEIDIFTQGAAIAFYTIFSIAPLLILVISVTGFFSSEELITEQIEMQLQEALGEDTTENMIQFIDDQTGRPTSLWTSITAGLIIIFGATTVIGQLKSVLNKIWGVKEIRMSSVWSFVLTRLVSFATLILLCILLLISVMAEGLVTMISSFFDHLLPGIPLDFYMYMTLITTNLFAALFFLIIFKVLPDVNARWRDLAIGAIVTTLLFILGKFLIGLYLSTAGIETTYRAAGTMVIFVIWVYYNVQTVLLGAIFTQVYTAKFGGEIRPYQFVVIAKT